MVAVAVISSTALLAMDLTYRCLDILLLKVEMVSKVKVNCRQKDVDNQEANTLSKSTCGVGTIRTQFEHSFFFFLESVL